MEAESKKRYTVKGILLTSFWVIAGLGAVALLVAAMNKKNSMRCASIDITIKGVRSNFFIDEADIRKLIEDMNGGKIEGVKVSQFNLGKMESLLKKNVWVREAEMYFDNDEHLQVEVFEREPVARVFTDHGSSFYIDSSSMVLPLSDKFSARLPVFTGFIEDDVMTKEDSALLKDIISLGEYIMADPFWMAQIEQVDIQPGRDFEMITKVGNHLIVFGDASDHQEKFRKLMIFYRDVISKTGWAAYSKVDVQYKGQIVAVKRGTEDITSDSLRTLQIMQAIVDNAQARMLDSINNIQLAAEEQGGMNMIAPVERDEPVLSIAPGISDDKKQTIINQPVTQPLIQDVKTEVKPQIKEQTKVTVPPVRKTEVKKTLQKKVVKPAAKTAVKKKPPVTKPKQQPKAVMPATNDY